MSVQPPDIQKGKGRLVLSFLCDLCVPCGYYSFLLAMSVQPPDIQKGKGRPFVSLRSLCSLWLLFFSPRDECLATGHPKGKRASFRFFAIFVFLVAINQFSSR